MKRKQLVIGGILLVIGVIAFIIGQSMHGSGYNIAMWDSQSRGEAMMQTANFVKFGGVGVGALGAIISMLSFLKTDSGSDG